MNTIQKLGILTLFTASHSTFAEIPTFSLTTCDAGTNCSGATPTSYQIFANTNGLDAVNRGIQLTIGGASNTSIVGRNVFVADATRTQILASPKSGLSETSQAITLDGVAGTITFSSLNGKSTIFDAVNEQVNFSGQVLSGVTNAALNASSSQAVSGQQLFATNNNVTAVTNRMTTAEGNITAVTNRVTTAEGNITNLQTGLTATNANVTAVTNRVTTAEGNITTLQSGLATTNNNLNTTNTNLTAVTNRVTTAEGNITDLDRRLLNVEALFGNDIVDLESEFKEINDRIDGKFKKFDEKINKGFAMSAAINGLFQPYNVGNFNLSIAGGGYNSENALAVGSGYRFNEMIAIKSGIAFTTSNSNNKIMYNVGANFEW